MKSDERITDIPIPNECKNCIFSAFKQFQTRWIPVEERLPEEQGEYLVTVKNLVATTKTELIDIALWNDKIEDNRGFLKADEVTAWMPLPKPYKRSEE